MLDVRVVECELRMERLEVQETIDDAADDDDN